jgi:acyl carrier protein
MADESAREALARRGLRAMAPNDALNALEQVLSMAPAHTTVAQVDWQTFQKSFEAWGPRRLLSDLATAQASEPNRQADHELAKALAALPARDRYKYLRAWITERCSLVLGHPQTVSLDPERGFFDLGLDSLMIVELRRQLEAGLGRRISPSVIFSYPDIGSLTAHLLESPLPASAPPAPPALEPDPARNVSPELPGEPSAVSSTTDTDEDMIRFINSKFVTEHDDVS